MRAHVRLVYTAAGTVLSALKVVICNKFLHGAYELHPLDLLARISPLAFVQTAVMVWLLEWYYSPLPLALLHIHYLLFHAGRGLQTNGMNTQTIL